jgi:peroxiredoxin Q/BCP
VCLFRDGFSSLTATGFSIYGLSSDSPKANTTFKTKQNLPYTLLCDPSATLIQAIGLQKIPKGTTRGVFIVDKAGKVLAAEKGGPQATVDIAKNVVDSQGAASTEAAKEDVEAAKTAGDVADTAAKLDG